MELSVVIPAYNEEECIGPCLDALVKQTATEPFEVLVIDNNSSDRTSEIANQYADRLNLRVIREPKQGRGTARATGFREAHGSIIFSTDADACVPPNWIESLAKHLRESHGVAVTGPCWINDCPAFTNAFFNMSQPIWMKMYLVVFRHYWLSGFNFAIRKEAYEKAGGFNTEIDAQEDTELGFRVRKVGKIRYVPTSVLVSGRRFKKGIIAGLADYIGTFVRTLFFKQKVELSNER